MKIERNILLLTCIIFGMFAILSMCFNMYYEITINKLNEKIKTLQIIINEYSRE